ncbi:MAG: hypothetical protein ACOY3P_26405 [Planctomycetota bacterium]
MAIAGARYVRGNPRVDAFLESTGRLYMYVTDRAPSYAIANSLLLATLLTGLASAAGAEPAPTVGSVHDRPDAAARVIEPTASYQPRAIRGWKVYVSRKLIEAPNDLGTRALELLDAKLLEVERVVPPDSLARVKQVVIWMEKDNQAGACHHPSRRWLEQNGYNPDKAGAVEIGNAEHFLEWSKHQPMMVLHELAHALHHRFVPDGHKNADILAAYEKAVADNRYDSVLIHNGRRGRAYAMKNCMEYFAELSEAWFGTNDIYPFVRAELREHDPAGAALMETIWR